MRRALCAPLWGDGTGRGMKDGVACLSESDTPSNHLLSAALPPAPSAIGRLCTDVTDGDDTIDVMEEDAPPGV